MIFIKHQSILDQDDLIYINKHKILPPNVFFNVENNIKEYLVPSIDVLITDYYNSGIKIFNSSERFKSELDNENELIQLDGDTVARNYCSFISINSKVLFHFPMQDKSYILADGELIIFPASFLYPFKTEILADGEIVELLYFFNRGMVVQTEEYLSRNRAY